MLADKAPIGAIYCADATFVGFPKKRGGGRRQMGAFIIHVSIHSVRIFDEGHRLSGIDATKRAPSGVISFGFWAGGLSRVEPLSFSLLRRQQVFAEPLQCG